jgi:hypothetical protein
MINRVSLGYGSSRAAHCKEPCHKDYWLVELVSEDALNDEVEFEK